MGRDIVDVDLLTSRYVLAYCTYISLGFFKLSAYLDVLLALGPRHGGKRRVSSSGAPEDDVVGARSVRRRADADLFDGRVDFVIDLMVDARVVAVEDANSGALGPVGHGDRGESAGH